MFDCDMLLYVAGLRAILHVPGDTLIGSAACFCFFCFCQVSQAQLKSVHVHL